MPRGRKRITQHSKQGVSAGVIGAVAGTVIGGATGILLSNKKAKKFIADGFEEVKGYTEDALESMNTMPDRNNQRLAKVGMKGGRSKTRSKSRKSR